MNSLIKDIKNLNKAEGFMQLNLIKGYSFTNKSGEIANYFADRDPNADFSLTFNNFVIKQPEEKVEGIRISSSSFWMHFISPESFELMNDHFNKIANDVLGILEIEKIRRIGWRNFFVYEFPNDAERDNSLEKHTSTKGLRLQEVLFASEVSDIQLAIRLRKVVKTDSAAIPGLLIDVDAYREYKDGLPIAEIPANLSDFKKMMRSEEFLRMLNILLDPNHG